MKVSSFDIFDTCLVRKCGTLENFFFTLGKCILPHATERDIVMFVRIRIESEKNARKLHETDISIKDIYDCADFSSLTSMSNEEIMQEEIRQEQLIWEPVLETRYMIEKHRQQGAIIIFISDMYLPQSIIKQWLIDNGFFLERDKIFISGENGNTKATGKLYKYIAEQLHIKSYKSWQHYGDNNESDFLIPKSLGIHAHKLSIDYTSYQLYWKKHIYNTKFPYASICAGISRAVKVNYPPSSAVDFSTDIIAPLLCTYVYRVMCEAVKDDICRLYFASRDAKILYEIAQILHPLFPSIKDIQYFYISRNAIKNSSEENILQYFIKIGLASIKDKVGFVDTGSSGLSGCTIERVNMLLEKHGYIKCRGYFFHYKLINDVDMYGEISEYPMCYVDPEKYTDMQEINSHLIEGFFTMTADNSILLYTDNGMIFQEKDDILCIDRNKTINIHFEVCKLWIKFALQSKIIDYLAIIFDNIAIATLFDFWLFPKKHYVQALLGYSIDDKPLVKEIRIIDAMQILFGRKIGRELWWKHGSFSLTFWGRLLAICKDIITKHIN